MRIQRASNACLAHAWRFGGSRSIKISKLEIGGDYLLANFFGALDYG